MNNIKVRVYTRKHAESVLELLERLGCDMGKAKNIDAWLDSIEDFIDLGTVMYVCIDSSNRLLGSPDNNITAQFTPLTIKELYRAVQKHEERQQSVKLMGSPVQYKLDGSVKVGRHTIDSHTVRRIIKQYKMLNDIPTQKYEYDGE